MRTLDFGCDVSISREGLLIIHDRYRLCSRLLAYLTFPEDLDRRNQFLATREALFLQHEFDRAKKTERAHATSEQKANQEPAVRDGDRRQQIAVERAQLICENFRTFGGGFGPLAAAAYDKPLAERLERGLEAAMLAGDRLLFTAAMATHHDTGLRGGRAWGKRPISSVT